MFRTRDLMCDACSKHIEEPSKGMTIYWDEMVLKIHPVARLWDDCRHACSMDCLCDLVRESFDGTKFSL